MKTDIQEKIKALIIEDLEKLKPLTEGAVWGYRDANFLNGSYDWLFFKFLSDNKLA